MNFLAHAVLSFNDPQVLTGNMISDFVKGKARYNFRGGIQKGISLHREIDRFTDTHPQIMVAKEIFKPAYRLYSGAIVDVCMDFFLANDKTIFPAELALRDFTRHSYHQISSYLDECPEKFQVTFSKMKQYNWLFNYRFQWGIERSLAGLVNRAKYITDYRTAFRLFLDNSEALLSSYEIFFPQLQQEARRQFGSG